MAFDKEEIKQLKVLFAETEKRINENTDAKILSAEKRINENTDKKIENLAVMTASGFNEVHKKLDDHSKQFQEVRRDINSLAFKESENIHKAEFFQLEERVDKIETKLKIA